MAESKKASIPAWQQNQSQSDTEPEEVTLEQARRFLNDDTVRNSTTEKKTEFLKSKGLDDDQVQKLLGEIEGSTQPLDTPSNHEALGESKNTDQKAETKPESEATPPDTTAHSIETPTPSDTPSRTSTTSDTPPIITYPEFLTTAPRPPPLLTPSRLANILTISGSVWTLLYGAARFVVNPMVENLDDARSDYYTHVNERLGQFVEKLEDAASEVPYKNGKAFKSKSEDGLYVDDESTVSDPTELFHRDFGTQTSPPASIASSTDASNSTEKPIDAQARRLSALKSSLRELSDMYTHQAEDSANLNATLREIHDDVEKLQYPPMPEFASIHSMSGLGRNGEPDDEVKKTKDAIRSVKGMFLSARSFPTAAATR